MIDDPAFVALSPSFGVPPPPHSPLSGPEVPPICICTTKTVKREVVEAARDRDFGGV